FNTLGFITAGAIGTAIGKKSKSTEDLKFPDSLRFLRDSMVSTTLLMIVLYLVFAVWGAIKLPFAVLMKIFPSSAGTPTASVGEFFMAALAQALQFGIGVAIILYGVRIILGELVPAFQGISERVVPGAKPALDVPIVFPFGPNSALIGFLSSFVGGLVALAFIAVWFGPVWGVALILPGMVPHFFDGGGAGVFGNATGGRRGAVAGGFINGIMITMLPAWLLTVMGSLGLANSTFGDTDFGWFGSVTGEISQLGPTGGALLMLLMVVVLVASAWVYQVRLVDRGWVPGKARAEWLEKEKLEKEKLEKEKKEATPGGVG
ncbi:MAG TPA: PTS transporter subunit IIC, partial [Dermatophilaceae bacterium]